MLFLNCHSHQNICNCFVHCEFLELLMKYFVFIIRYNLKYYFGQIWPFILIDSATLQIFLHQLRRFRCLSVCLLCLLIKRCVFSHSAGTLSLSLKHTHTRSHSLSYTRTHSYTQSLYLSLSHTHTHPRRRRLLFSSTKPVHYPRWT